MKNKIEPRYMNIGVMLFFLFAACAAVLVMLLNFGTVMAEIRRFLSAISPLFYGLAFAFLLNPLMMRFERLLLPGLKKKKYFEKHEKTTPEKAARALAVMLTALVALLIIFALFAMIIPQLTTSLATIASNLTTYFNNFQTWSTGILEDYPELALLVEQLFEKIYDYSVDWLSNDFLPFFTSLTTSIVSIIGAVLDVVIGLIISIYVLGSKDSFQRKSKRMLYSIFKIERANALMEDLRYTSTVFGKFIIGKLIDSLIIGVICFVVMSFLSLPYPLLISIVIGVTNIIPFFGPFLGAIPSTFFILVVSPVQALWFIVFIILLQQLDGNFIGPRILGDATGVPGFWVVVSILIFSALLGVVGMIIAVPTFAVISMIVARWADKSLNKKGIDQDLDFHDLDHIDPDTMEPVIFDKTQGSEE